MQNNSGKSDLIWPPYSPPDSDREIIEIERGEGAWLYTSDGRRIFDAISSWWVNIHGHSHPAISEAIGRQARTLEHVIFSGFRHKPAENLVARLRDLLPGNPLKFFFSDNGSTAVEVALKMAIRAAGNRKKLLAFSSAYHGDTFGAMAVSARGTFNEEYAHLLFEPEFVPYPEAGKEEYVLEEIEKIFRKGKTGAFIFEPLVLGAAGMKMYSEEALAGLLDLCRRYEVISIADEVFTGFGRTGKMFACSGSAGTDISVYSKGITGGFLPMGLTVCNEQIVRGFGNESLYHGHSYTGNPLSCAAACANLEVFEQEKTLEKVALISGWLKDAASGMKVKGAGIRQTGTILAIESGEGKDYHSDFSRKGYDWFLGRNLLIRPLGNVVYICPPYCSTHEEIIAACMAMEEFFNTRK